MVCAVTGVWADPTITKEYDWYGRMIQVKTTEPGSITSDWINNTLIPACEPDRVILAVDGPINQVDIDAIAGITSGPIVVIDYGKTSLSGLTVTVPAQAIGLRLPVTEDLTASYTLKNGSPSNLQYVMSSGMNGVRYHSGDDEKGSDHINLHITDQAGVSAFVSHYGGQPSWIAFRNINLSTIVEDLDYSALLSAVSVSDGFKITYPADNTGEEYVVPISECRECSIDKDSENKIATVHTVHPGHFKARFQQNFNYTDYKGWTFKFDNACNLNEADLLTLVGNQTSQSNEFYVDLFDVPATAKLCNWEGSANPGIITMVIKEICERNSTITDQHNNYGFKGLILPKDHTIYGTGTTLIQGINKGAAGDIATCKEFIVYHKTLKEDGVTPVDKLTVAHIYQYQSNGAVSTYQAAYDKMMSLLNAHTEIAQTDIYQVSTNFQLRSDDGSYEKIDISDLPTGKSIVETYNNEMVGAPTRALMISHPAEGGDFATSATATSMMRTTTEKLTIVGPMSESDYAAIGTFAEGKGPRILDLRGVTTDITEALLNKIGNSEIEYLVLPETADRDLIFANYKTAGNMSRLKAVINAAPSQSSQPTIVANIYEPGSLYEARIHALDLAIGADGIYHLYSGCGVQSVTLKGSLNASDIAAQVSSKTDHQNSGTVPIFMGADGHWADVASETPANLGLGYEQGTLTSFDLEEAVFNTKTDMNFWKAGYEKLTSVKLPTATEMDLIPANCFCNISTLKDLCVPYNYKYIQDGAFWLTSIDHMTTTDAAGAEVDNGPKSWTISANMKELGTRPTNAKEFVSTVFPMNVGVQDIYCLAVKVPKCYANVFALNTSYGWGGDDPNQPYCRDKYFNGGDKMKAWAVLRFPSKESFDAAPDGMKETITTDEIAVGLGPDAYTKMKQLYTDVNKKFTKMEQTGAVDANGDPITWPSHYEGYRVYNQASFGYTWNDWAETHDLTNDGHVNGGESVNQGTAAGEVYTNSEVEADGGTGTGEGDYSFDDYIGWHQIVLSQATHVNPDEIVVEDKIVRNYVYAGSFTFCIPYDLTYSQVVRMMGVPLSTDKVDNYYGANKVTGADGKVTYTGGTLIDDESKIMMPEIRQLKSVIRTKGTNGGSNSVNFRLTTNLVKELTYTDSENETHRTATAGYLNFYEDENGKWTMGTIYPGSDGEEDPICLVGGRPYIIKAYMREGETITGRNLGKYIMTRYADEFGSSASCINSSEYAEQLETFKKVQDSGEVKVDETDLETMRFAKPYENHKVQAIDGGENSVGALNYTENDKTTRYYYTMVGQFWEQDLPLYCVYMGQNGSWYRYSKDNGKNYKWNAYKCVIMATPEVTAVGDIEEEDIKDAMGITAAQDVPANAIPMPFKALPTKDWTFNHFGGGFRNISHCYFPMNYLNTEDWIPGPMSLWFIGRDDYTFKNQTGANSRYIFSIDDDEEIVDLGENVTEVKAIDMLDGVPQIYGDMKVYNLSGQYVGNSTEGLSKGIYIVGGRKVVVE